MSIIINAEVTRITTQEYKFASVSIRKEILTQKLMAVVSFDKIDQNGKKIDTVSITYKNDEYNTFWTNFNNGTYLYSELNTHQHLNVNPLPEMEQDFKNP